jgi:hypothetical protein
MGAPSSHLEGGAVARNSNPDAQAEALAGMARIGSPRQPMGQQGFAFNDPSGEPSPNTTPIAKKHSKDVNPAAGGKANRKGVMLDRNGAQYRITAKFPPHSSPEAGATQAHGRIISAAKPELGNFSQEMGASRI